MSSDPRICSLEDALKDELWLGLESGTYKVEYRDRTHTEEWVPLLELEIADISRSLPWEGPPSFKLRPARGVCREERAAPSAEQEQASTANLKTEDARRGKEKDEERRLQHRRRDALAQVLLRVGILGLALERPEGVRMLYELGKERSLVLVPDTNALSNGTLVALIRALPRTQIWLLPAVTSLMQLQEHDRRIKAAADSPDKKIRGGNILRSRALVNASFSLLERLRDHVQVLEVEPELLRYLRPAGDGTKDPDHGDVLEDRLLVEAIHTVFRTTRTRTARRVVTSDIMLARVLHLEGIPEVLLQVPDLPDEWTPCVRYDALARGFVGAPLSFLLWDMAHTFASIRLTDAAGTARCTLDCYWPGKAATDWRKERLRLSVAERAGPGSLSRVALPEVSFVTALRAGGIILALGEGRTEEIRQRLPDSPGEEVVRMAGELLMRGGFVTWTGSTLVPTDRLRELDTALASGDLDQASCLWEACPPYRELLRSLKEKGVLPLNSVRDVLATAIEGRAMPSTKASERFARIPVYLGQAWTHQDELRDGSGRPSDDEIARKVVRLFDELSKDGLCDVEALLRRLCEDLHLSPWRAASQLVALVEQGELNELSFAPAAGPGRLPKSRDRVIQGGLQDVHEMPVAPDRLSIRSRQVFTVSRGSA